MMLRSIHCLLVVILPLTLFFSLFFGLNYPEIVRHGWPRSYCTVLGSEIANRYCCETSCNHGCSNAPPESPQCGRLISQLDDQYTPSGCAANSSACPPRAGAVCDGGYQCCSTCCDTCSSCSTTCWGDPPTCKTTCSYQSCNCSCCSDVFRLYCTVYCPVCYNVNLKVRYKTAGGNFERTTYSQDFRHDNNSASWFFSQHLVNSTSPCYYNPHDFSQVLFDVSFTAWKWVITTIFGIFPLAVVLIIFACIFLMVPAVRLGNASYNHMTDRLRNWNENRALIGKSRLGRRNRSTDRLLPSTHPQMGNAASNLL